MGNFESIQIITPDGGEVEQNAEVRAAAGQTPVTPPEDPGDDPVGQPSSGEPERPEFLLPKFKTMEEQAKAYVELEKQLGKRQPPKAGDTPPPVKEGEKPPATQLQPTELDAFEKEFAETGTLSEASYAALGAKGLPKHVVDGYIAGQMARGEAQVQQVYNLTGGAENYAQMVEWAKGSLSNDERAAYDAAVDSKDMSKAMFAARGLWAQFQQAQGTQPQLLKGKASGGSAVAPFMDTAQLKEAMSDPRYKTSEAYRQEVARRLQNSSIL